MGSSIKIVILAADVSIQYVYEVAPLTILSSSSVLNFA